MRMIKFRAWDETEKRMIYADTKLGESFAKPEIDVQIDLEGDVYITEMYPYENPSLLINKLLLLQFTGLTDKNGVEIYEGDHFKNTETGSVFEVFYGENTACYRAKRQDGWHFDLQQLYPIDNWEVVGNIYEKEAADE